MLVGLTGGIATGKSTLSDYLVSKKHILIDADRISRDSTLPGKPAYRLIIKHFGNEILTSSNPPLIDRTALGSIVFVDAKKRALLNSLVHPFVKLEMLRQIICGLWSCPWRIIFVDVPLLFETGLDKFCDCTVLVACSSATQLQRLMLREPSYTEEHALQRINSQMSLELKKKKSTFVLYNDESREIMYNNFEKIYCSVKCSSFLQKSKDCIKMGFYCAIFVLYCCILKIKFLSFMYIALCASFLGNKILCESYASFPPKSTRLNTLSKYKLSIFSEFRSSAFCFFSKRIFSR